MKRSLFTILVLIALGLGTTFVASAVFSTPSSATNGGGQAPQKNGN